MLFTGIQYHIASGKESRIVERFGEKYDENSYRY
jgi:hypothetical protein